MFNDSFNKALATAHYKGNFLEMAYNFYRLKAGESIEPRRDDFYERERRCFQCVPMLIEQMVKRQVCDKLDFDRCLEEAGQSETFRLYDDNNPPTIGGCNLKYLKSKKKRIPDLMTFKSPDICDCLTNHVARCADKQENVLQSHKASNLAQNSRCPQTFQEPQAKALNGQNISTSRNNQFNNSSNIQDTCNEQDHHSNASSNEHDVEKDKTGICDFQNTGCDKNLSNNINNSGKEKSKRRNKGATRCLDPAKGKGSQRATNGNNFYWPAGCYGGQDYGDAQQNNSRFHISSASSHLSPEAKMLLLKARLKNFKHAIGNASERLDEMEHKVKLRCSK